eukprot:CAMPEP_0180388812 /NCGR_PEP_ID=MMETSP0989-20121125/31040_1 /TAXON_ID=697907 /ORGANISM="non described non described, Strain CCMP2293" /LENGTH=92 /DNA_ID=CAMNT_0022389903 /DNA_START=10 /DNA_END=284 /DNA_ORIENTATION=-
MSSEPLKRRGGRGGMAHDGEERSSCDQESHQSERSSLVVALFVLLGCGLLLPWNALITALDFFAALFPTRDPADAFAIANFTSNLAFLAVQL